MKLFLLEVMKLEKMYYPLFHMKFANHGFDFKTKRKVVSIYMILINPLECWLSLWY